MAIKIKKANVGKFTAYKKRTGKSTSEALHSKSPAVRKMANFARNAKKWHHAEGGIIQYPLGGQLSSQNMKANQYANTIQQTQKSAASMIPGASIVSPIAGTVADFVDKDNQYGVSKDWSSGVRGAIDPSMSLSRAAGDIGSGKFTWNTAADLAFPIVGEILSNQNKRSMIPKPFNPQQQFTNPGYKPTFPGGGIIPNAQPNIELEKNEVLQGPDGSAVQVNAPSHAQGGIDLAAEGGGRVFSDRIINPETGNTFADDAAKLLKQIKNKR